MKGFQSARVTSPAAANQETAQMAEAIPERGVSLIFIQLGQTGTEFEPDERRIGCEN